MTSLKSSTLLFAAFAPAPVSSEAVSRPLITRGQDAYFEERDELLLRVDLAARRRCGLYAPCRTQDAVAVERRQAGEEAWPRSLGRRLQREHLDMALANSKMVAVPADRTLHDLPIHAGIAAKLVLAGPFLQIEEVAEELEGLVLAQQSQANRTAEMALKDRRCLLKVRQHP